MADTEALRIVQTALALRRTHPDAPALDVLDLAMQDQRGTAPSFEDDDVPGMLIHWHRLASYFSPLSRLS